MPDDKVVPFGPMYQAELNVHLPKDHMWGRQENRNIKRVIQSRRGPDLLWQQAMAQMLEILGLTDARFTVGLLLNLINGFPEDIRAQIAYGIVEGLGLTIGPDEKGELTATIAPQFISLGGPEGEKRTPSGLILPS